MSNEEEDAEENSLDITTYDYDTYDYIPVQPAVMKEVKYKVNNILDFKKT
jgi:hypothetical protein